MYKELRYHWMSIKFEPFCLHLSCTPKTCGSNFYACKIDQTWSTLNVSQPLAQICYSFVVCLSLFKATYQPLFYGKEINANAVRDVVNDMITTVHWFVIGKGSGKQYEKSAPHISSETWRIFSLQQLIEVWFDLVGNYISGTMINPPTPAAAYWFLWSMESPFHESREESFLFWQCI